MKVIDGHVHDNKTLPELVNDIIKSNSITAVGKVFAEGAYEGNDTLDICQTVESFKNIIQKMMLKASLYNKFVSF